MRICLLLGVLLVSVGCSVPKAIVYKVSGTALSADMTYANSGGGTSQVSNASLPWEYSFSASPTSKSSVFLYISAQNATATGSVTAEIYVDGKLEKTSSSTGAYVIATASESLSSY